MLNGFASLSTHSVGTSSYLIGQITGKEGKNVTGGFIYFLTKIINMTFFLKKGMVGRIK